MAKESVDILKGKIDVKKVLEQLNAALAEEWLAFYQYWAGALIIEGPMRTEVQKEMEEHAQEEYEHAKLLADRIIELEGVPVLSPQQWFDLARCKYLAPDDFGVVSILNQNIASERCAIKRYSEIANFTDGLDGLATSVTLMIAVFFMVVSIGTNSGIAPVTAALAGALMGFLLFNVYPARVFMGDTGSLALGGFVAATAYMMKMPLFILIVAFIYLMEIVTVMMQVTYFKITKKIYGQGRRIFKMTPIHHHFEKCGYMETQIVAAFTVITAVLCLLGYVAL